MSLVSDEMHAARYRNRSFEEKNRIVNFREMEEFRCTAQLCYMARLHHVCSEWSKVCYIAEVHHLH